jgi:hypothetical protein
MPAAVAEELLMPLDLVAKAAQAAEQMEYKKLVGRSLLYQTQEVVVAEQALVTLVLDLTVLVESLLLDISILVQPALLKCLLKQAQLQYGQHQVMYQPLKYW